MPPARAPAEELPRGAAKTAHVRAMFDTIAPRYDALNRIMSLGLDQRWRRRAIDALGIGPGATVLDLACGTGDLSRACARRGYRVLGDDLSYGMLSVSHAGTPRVQGDASALPLASASVDAIICGYGLRNFDALDQVVGEAARVLRPGGRIVVLEIAIPPSAVMRAGYHLWFERVVPVVGGLLSDPAAYRYLPRSTGYLPTPQEFRELLLRHGFATAGHQLLDGGLSQLFTATRVGMPSDAATPPSAR